MSRENVELVRELLAEFAVTQRAVITPYRVAVKLSKPRLCNGRYQYLKLTYRFLTGPRRGRSASTGFSWVCT